MTQTRPRLDDDQAAEVQAYASAWHLTFSTAVKILIRAGLDAAPVPRANENGKEKP
jgi:hypothetical protein